MTKDELEQKIYAITQEGETVPEGYTFDPRATPPLFKTEGAEVADSKVARKQLNERNKATS